MSVLWTAERMTETELLVEGEFYSKNKRVLKKIFKAHGLEWKGHGWDGPFVWRGNEGVEVEAVFNRDMDADVTIDAIIWVRGNNLRLLQAISEWAEPGLKEKVVDQSDIDDQLEWFEGCWRAKIENAERNGAPAGWLRNMKKERDEGRKALLAKLMS